MTKQTSIEQEYAAVLAASMNYKRRAESAEARAAQAEQRIAGLDRGLAKSDEIIAQLEAERDDYKVRMQSWHDSAMTLADQRDAAYRRNIDLETERDELARQIAAAVAEEREACAELAKSMIGATRHEIADAIRARK